MPRTAPVARLRRGGWSTTELDGGAVAGHDGAATARPRCVLRHTLDEHGVLRVSQSVTNRADRGRRRRPLDVGALRALLPLPSRATEVLDLTGRWCRERSPQRSALQDGTHLRASRRGRTGHDATLLLTVGTAGFGFRTGEVWSVHVAWSGNHEHLAERLPEGAGVHAAVLGGGELLEPGEVRLGAGGDLHRPPTWSSSTRPTASTASRAGCTAASARRRPTATTRGPSC